MPSTEFLLYLVTVVLIVVLVMNYMGQDNDKEKEKENMTSLIEMLKKQEKKEKNFKVHHDDDEDERSKSSQSGSCNNPKCIQSGVCNCKQRVNLRVDNLNGRGGIGGPPVPPIDPLRKFDYDAVNDDFTPPFRRSYYDDFILPPALYPTYTRGPPGRFRKVGTLVAQGVVNGDKYKFLNLMGREKYPGREYEYYVTSVDAESKIKFYIETKGKEIRDGDAVKVKNLEGYVYIFSEDEDLSPKYDPYFVY